MPASEFASWLAYFQIEPWGSHALETVMAQVCQSIIAGAGTPAPEMQSLMPFASSIRRLTPTKASPVDAEARFEAKMAKGRLFKSGG